MNIANTASCIKANKDGNKSYLDSLKCSKFQDEEYKMLFKLATDVWLIAIAFVSIASVALSWRHSHSEYKKKIKNNWEGDNNLLCLCNFCSFRDWLQGRKVFSANYFHAIVNSFLYFWSEPKSESTKPDSQTNCRAKELIKRAHDFCTHTTQPRTLWLIHAKTSHKYEVLKRDYQLQTGPDDLVISLLSVTSSY